MNTEERINPEKLKREKLIIGRTCSYCIWYKKQCSKSGSGLCIKTFPITQLYHDHLTCQFYNEKRY